MGCWNATCNVSNLPIYYGDEVVLIPLMKVKNKTRFNTCYATDNFVPFAFPIFGKYDEYGGIEDIVPDELNETLLRSYEYWYYYDEEYTDRENKLIPIAEKNFERFVNDVLCCHEGAYIKMNTGLHKNDMVEINYIMVHYELYLRLLNDAGNRVPYGSDTCYQQCLFNSFKKKIEKCKKMVDDYEKLMVELPDKKAYFEAVRESEIINRTEDVFSYGTFLNPSRRGWATVMKKLVEDFDEEILKKVVSQTLFTQALSFLRKGYHCDSGAGSQSEETHMHRLLAEWIIDKISNNAIERNADVDDEEDMMSENGVKETIFFCE